MVCVEWGCGVQPRFLRRSAGPDAQAPASQCSSSTSPPIFLWAEEAEGETGCNPPLPSTLHLPSPPRDASNQGVCMCKSARAPRAQVEREWVQVCGAWSGESPKS